MNPMPDHERVTGQIARGEVLAGPAAARLIAARAEAAYGAAFRPAPTAEQQWAEALAEVFGGEAA